MLTLLFISLFAVGVVSTSPPDISGTWHGDDWGQLTLTQTSPGEYTGTYTDTVAKEKGPGKIDLKWSRIERAASTAPCARARTTALATCPSTFGNEIRDALTTSDKSKINPATPRLADFVWIRAESPWAAAATPPASQMSRAMPTLCISTSCTTLYHHSPAGPRSSRRTSPSQFRFGSSPTRKAAAVPP